MQKLNINPSNFSGALQKLRVVLLLAGGYIVSDEQNMLARTRFYLY